MCTFNGFLASVKCLLPSEYIIAELGSDLGKRFAIYRTIPEPNSIMPGKMVGIEVVILNAELPGILRNSDEAASSCVNTCVSAIEKYLLDKN